jgi:hypothetical protein
VICNTYAEEEL